MSRFDRFEVPKARICGALKPGYPLTVRTLYRMYTRYNIYQMQQLCLIPDTTAVSYARYQVQQQCLIPDTKYNSSVCVLYQIQQLCLIPDTTAVSYTRYQVQQQCLEPDTKYNSSVLYQIKQPSVFFTVYVQSSSCCRSVLE